MTDGNLIPISVVFNVCTPFGVLLPCTPLYVSDTRHVHLPIHIREFKQWKKGSNIAFSSLINSTFLIPFPVRFLVSFFFFPSSI